MNAKQQQQYIRYLWLTVASPFILLILFILGVLAFAKLPSFEELENPKSNLASEVISSDQKVLGTYYFENRSNVHYNELSPNIVNALKATEDIRFEEHSGVDIKGLFRVIFKTVFLHQSSSGGGSTITQQLAKNLFPRENVSKFGLVTLKLKEWIIAVKLERNYTKEEIMALYLNTVEFGSNAFGIKSAARTFFNKAPIDLTVNEAATLIGLLKAPSYYSPVRNPKRAAERRNVVLSQMEKYNIITEGKFDTLKALPIVLKYQSVDHNSGTATYFRESLRLEMTRWCEEHKKPNGDPYNIYTDGLKIYTTINSKMQLYAEEAVQEHLSDLQKSFFTHWKGKGAPWGEHTEVITEAMHRSDRYIAMKKDGTSDSEIKKIFNTPIGMSLFTWHGDRDTVLSPLDSIKYYKYFLQTGFMSMEPQTGYIRAWVGGINYKYFKYDHVKEGKRQVGSTFKPFLYTLAMQEGYSPCMKIPNTPVTFELGPGQAPYTPQNAEPDDDGKMMTLKEALAKSVNRISAYLMKQFGPQAVVAIAHKMGITSQMDAVPALCLGTPDLSVYEMTGAYSVYANKGIWTEPIYITRIEDKNGNVLEERLPRKVEAISEETAYLMLNLLQGVVQHGTGVRLRYKYKLNQTIAGKTGTTQNHSDGWFMGITPELVSGCWVGCEDRAVHFRSMELGQGASMALPIWGLYMQKVYADKTLKVSQGGFERPSQPITTETDCAKYDAGSSKESSFGKDF